jgi:hypothetical protein
MLFSFVLQPWAAKNEILHLLQLQMTLPQLGSGNKQTYASACDEFRCLILKPLYVRKQQPCVAKGAV